jgi:transmembrane sensor
MIAKDEFIKLYQKYLEGRCTPQEIEQLEAYKDDLNWPHESWQNDLGDKNELYSRLRNKIHESIGHTNHHRWYSNVKLKLVALMIISLSIGLYFWIEIKAGEQQRKYATARVVHKIMPGGNKAYLTTTNGSIITLDGAANGLVTAQSGIKISKVKEGLLKYTSDRTSTSGETGFNLISTPRGGQYQVELADGTHVWLNSATSLKFPANFTGNERKVELSGEAYFEVAKNPSKPFLVTANGVTVKVLGTHFNIMGYADEKEVKTTLLEGSVKLSYNGNTAMLNPGQQGSIGGLQTAFKVDNVDVDDIVAWKNGLFAFNNEDIQTIMKRISRWYDVDVVFPENFKRKNFGGTISRFKDVSQVLTSLELTRSVHFKLEGRRIIVMP